MTSMYKDKQYEFYDMEVLKNILTFVTYNRETKHFNIYVETENGGKDQSLNITEFWNSDYCEDRNGNPVSVKDIVLEHFYYINREFIDHVGATYAYGDYKEYIQSINETPQNDNAPIRFGFNSSNYDLPMIAYTASKPPTAHPDTPMLRSMSDNIINHKRVWDAFGNDSIFKNKYQQLRYSNKFIDIQALNESMSMVSLKRLSAQAGYNIIESDRLSGDNAFVETLQHICDLVGYNGNDVIVTHNLFHENEYIGPFTTKTELLENYPDNYKSMLAADATSAKFVEHIIVPKEKHRTMETPLKDDPRINFFYPMNMELHPELNELLIQYKSAAETLHNNYKTALEQQPENEQDITDTYKRTKQEYINVLNEQIDGNFNALREHKRYRFNDELDQMEEDVLEHLKDEYGIPDKIYNLYAGIRGQVSLDEAKENLYRNGVIPRGSSIAIHIPIRKSNAYVTFSIGGAHGEYFSYEEWEKFERDLIEQNEELEAFNETLRELQEHYGATDDGATEYLMTKKNKTTLPKYSMFDHKTFVTGSYKNGATWKAPKKLKVLDDPKNIKKFAKTVYVENVGHADVDSLYPTLLKNLKVFMQYDDDGNIIDRYGEILIERLRLKNLLPEDKSTWTSEHKAIDRAQKRLKLLLNSASGVADAAFDNNVRVNNKTLKMRICGQLILASVVYDLTDAGATVVSTNTDGVYFTDMLDKWDDVERIINKWTSYFSIGATPETVDLFISKDSNNRLEVNNNKISSAAGGTIASYEGINFSKALSKPVIADFLLVDQLKNRDNPLDHYDKDRAIALMQQMINGVKSGTIKNIYGKNRGEIMTVADLLMWFQWIFSSNPSKKNFFVPYDSGTLEIKAVGKVHRGFAVKEGNTRMSLITMNKTNKETHPLAEKLAHDLQVAHLKDKGNHISFKKHAYLPLDNRIEHHNESVSQIDPTILDRLDLEVYANIAEELWGTWSKSYDML